MNLAVDYPWVLLALLVSLLPLFNNGVTQSPYPSIEIIPNDRLSSCISVLIKLIAVAAAENQGNGALAK